MTEFNNCTNTTAVYKLRIATQLLSLVVIILFSSCDAVNYVDLTDEQNQESELSLVEGRQNSTITVSSGDNSYYSLDISGRYKSDLSTAETRNGWCIAWNDQISSGTTHENLRLYTTFGEEHWKSVNYLLNIKESLMAEDRALTRNDIQAAIWSLLEFSDFDINSISSDKLPADMVQNGSFKFDKQRVEKVIQRVNSRFKSFQYEDHSTYAVVVETSSGQSKMIVEVKPYIIEMTDLKAEYGFVVAWDINDNGQIVGGNSIWDDQRGMVDMGSIFAKAINNHGSVVGTAGNETILWDHSQGARSIEQNGSNNWIEAHDINDAGQVAGEIVHEYLLYEDEDYGDVYEYHFSAFVWQQGDEIKNINNDGEGWANSINDQGQVAGLDYSVPNRAFIWDQQNGISGLGSYYGYSSGRANSINNSGQVVGSVLVSSGEENSLYAGKRKLEKQAQIRDIDKLLQKTRTKGIYDPGHVAEMIKESTFDAEAFPWRRQIKSQNTFLASSNDLNQYLSNTAVSSYKSEAFIWDEDNFGMMSLGTLGGDWSTAWDINDEGHVVGYSSYAPGKSSAFFWNEEYGMIELPTFGGNSLARAINNKGQMVGYSYDSDGSFYPVMWEISFVDF